MKNIEFVTQGNLLRVKVDGKILLAPNLDLKVIKAAVAAKAVSPAMKDGMFKNIKAKLADEGLSADEVKIVVKRFEEAFS